MISFKQFLKESITRRINEVASGLHRDMIDEADHFAGNYIFWGYVTPKGKIIDATSDPDYKDDPEITDHPELFKAITGTNGDAMSKGSLWIRWYVEKYHGSEQLELQTAIPTPYTQPTLVKRMLQLMTEYKGYYKTVYWDFPMSPKLNKHFGDTFLTPEQFKEKLRTLPADIAEHDK